MWVRPLAASPSQPEAAGPALLRPGGSDRLSQASVTNTKETQVGEKADRVRETRTSPQPRAPLPWSRPPPGWLSPQPPGTSSGLCVRGNWSPARTSFINRQLVTLALYFSIFCLISWTVGGSGFSSSTVCVTFWNQKGPGLAGLGDTVQLRFPWETTGTKRLRRP